MLFVLTSALSATPSPDRVADASTVEWLSSASPQILLGQVVSRRFETVHVPKTLTTIRVERVIKGSLSVEEVVFATFGGRTESGRWAVSPGAEFTAPLPGQRVILSGVVSSAGEFTPTHSAFSVLRESQEGLRGSGGSLVALRGDGQFVVLKATLPPAAPNEGWTHIEENGDVVPDAVVEAMRTSSEQRQSATPALSPEMVELTLDEIAALLAETR